MERKGIAIVTNSLKGGGTEKFISNLLFEISDDLEIHLLMTESKMEFPLPQNVKVSYLSSDFDKVRTQTYLWEYPLFFFKLPIYAYRLKKYCEANGLDTIVAFLERSNYIACLSRVLRFHGKIFISERTNITKHYGKNLRGNIGRMVVRFLYPKSDGIIVNSKGSENALKKVIGESSKFYLVRNILDISDINMRSAENVTDCKFDDFSFVYLAGFREGKNQRMVIEAFRQVSATSNGIKLILLGDGETKKDCIKFVEEIGLLDRVIFLGHVANPFKYLSRSHCFVFGSDFEGFPNVLLEAMACGLPVISTDCNAGPRELIADNDNYDAVIRGDYEIHDFGVLTKVGDSNSMAAAMTKILTDSDLREKLSQNGKERINEFGSEEIARKFRLLITDN